MSKNSIINDITEKIKGADSPKSITPNLLGNILVDVVNQIPEPLVLKTINRIPLEGAGDISFETSSVIPYGTLQLYAKGVDINGTPNLGGGLEMYDLVKGWVSPTRYWESAIYLGDINGNAGTNPDNFKAGIEIDYLTDIFYPS